MKTILFSLVLIFTTYSGIAQINSIQEKENTTTTEIKKKVFQTSVSNLQKQTELHQLIQTSSHCEIYFFELTLVPTSGDVFSRVNRTSSLDKPSLKLINSAKSGDKIYIEKIKSVGDCMNYQHRGVNSYQIEVL